jgi:hypothetical protein
MASNMPTDEKLYNKTKAEVDKVYDKPSAYRSMAYTRFYLRAYREKYGNDKKAYTGKKPGDLEKWRREKWIDVRSYVDTPDSIKPCGAIEYGKKEYPLCMPEKKIKRYDKSELVALLNRKAELGKTRLVKDPFLRDMNLVEEPKADRVKAVPVAKVKRVKLPVVKREPRKIQPKIEKAIRMKKEVKVEKNAINKPVVQLPAADFNVTFN